MNHQYDQRRVRTTTVELVRYKDLIEPGQVSRSAALHRPDHALLSGLVLRKARDAGGVAKDAEHAVTAASRSTGSPLPSALMRKFELSLGADLSAVRVHTGSGSAQAADAVGARAYTLGNDIHFALGQYDLSSAAGELLLAHEVAHTVQQSGAAQGMQYKLKVSSPGDSFEREADCAAEAMVAGRPATVSAASGLARVPAENPVRTAAPDGGGGGGADAGSADGGTAAQTQPDWATPELKRQLTAVVLAESADTQEEDIKWIYLDRVTKARGEAGLRASAAYRNKSIWYRIWLYILGDETYGDNALPKGQDFEGFDGFDDVAAFCAGNGWVQKVAVPRAERLTSEVKKMFESPSRNPHPGWSGQGNLRDFNNESNKDVYWTMARAYYWLQVDKKVTETCVKILPAGKNTQVIFDGAKIKAYWKKNTLPKDVRKYNP